MGPHLVDQTGREFDVVTSSYEERQGVEFKICGKCGEQKSTLVEELGRY